MSLRYVKNVKDLKDPDMIIIPGTKNTMQDLVWLRESGMEAAILKAAAKGKVIFGVCGGYQMLGESLSDPDGVEEGGELKGLGLLPMDTVFKDAKTRTRVTGKFENLTGTLASLNGVELEGYEIHMGESTLKENANTITQITDFVEQKTKNEGANINNVYGTYVHGVFDKEQVANGVIKALADKKGVELNDLLTMDFAAYKEQQYDILADTIRESLDMKKIYEVLEMGV